MIPDPPIGPHDEKASLRAQLLPTCREMSRHTSRTLEGKPGWKLRLGMAIHLLFCRLCRRYSRQLRWLRSTAAAVPDSAAAATVVAPSEGSDSERRERLRRRLREATTETSRTGSTSGNTPNSMT